jgi:3'(2'), 5'-bisphosphate nucleotidase
MRDAALDAMLRRLAIEAGAAIMDIYGRSEISVAAKADDSPVTEADLAADRIIVAGLEAAYPDIPVVTEERAASHGVGGGATHFLVDPLDGTKEFIQRRGEFTVNIALIEDDRPTAGVVYAPAIGRLFRTVAGGGAVEETGPFDPERGGAPTHIEADAPVSDGLVVVASKSHRDAATDDYIARYKVEGFRSAGSSLKFCLVAAGEAHLYPRLGPTMEWDTAAGQAVLEAARGAVLELDGGTPLRYGKPLRKNPYFVALAPGIQPLSL